MYNKKKIGVVKSSVISIVIEMSLFNDLSMGSAMDDGTSKYMLDGNEIHNLSANHFLVNEIIFFPFQIIRLHCVLYWILFLMNVSFEQNDFCLMNR